MSHGRVTEAERSLPQRRLDQRRDLLTTIMIGMTTPASAGLDGPADPKPPTWEDALAHAEVLRAQGVKVRIDEGRKSITIRDTNGEFHDPADGTPASQTFYPDGTPMWISHFTDGKYHDPADGTPAWQTFYPDGTPMWISHYTDGKYHDPADGTPARRGFYPDGATESISHWTNGKLVGEESFPPPTGEA